MKRTIMIIICTIELGFLMCSGSNPFVKLGNCPLTVNLKAEGEDFNGYANVYINRKFIGTTDRQTQLLRISLKPGEYTIWVIAEGYEPWRCNILLLGKGYKQNVLADLQKTKEPNKLNTKD